MGTPLRTTARRVTRVAGLLATALVISLFLASASQAAGPYTGQIHGCNYSITLDTSAHTFTADTTNCSSLGVNANLTGSWAKDQITIGHVTASIAFNGGTQLIDQDINFSFGVGIDLDKAQDTAQDVQDQVHSALQGALDKGEDELVQLAAAKLVGYGTGIDPQQKINDLLKNQTDFCSNYDSSSTSPASCTPPDCSPDSCTHLPAGSDPPPGENADSDSEQDALCPFLNQISKHFVFACTPAYLTGNIDTGNRSLVLLPGSALISLSSSPLTVSSSHAIVSLGGMIAGGSIELKAPNVGFAAGAVEMLNKVVINASHRVSIGTVNLDTFTGTLPDFVSAFFSQDSGWHQTLSQATGDNLPNELPTKGSFTLPAQIAASSVEIRAPGGFILGSSSNITTKGFGAIGQIGSAPGAHGETGHVGGSHGGLGGYRYPDNGGDAYNAWHSILPRGAAFDDPFKPTQPGDGGGGDGTPNDFGLPGGGAVQVDSHAGIAVINGTIDVSGFDNGICGICGDHGGAGAGGSAYITAASLTGSGEINADGGSFCTDCGNAGGGGGAGGRIAAIYGSNSFVGKVHASGGYDHHYAGLANDGGNFRGTGGAGTLFLRQVAFDASGNVASGAGSFPDGTLYIDAQRPANAYPPPDGTPLLDAWNSTNRRLVIRGRARVYGQHPNYGQIDVLGDSKLTTDPTDTNHTLDVTAKSLHVDAGSRIDVDGRGYPGGNPTGTGDGGAPNGQTAATENAGGSHGGSGGRAATNGGSPPGHPGSTYDDAHAPSQPGGGGAGDTINGSDIGNAGGGVLTVHTGSLNLDGVLSANGQDGNGPTRSDPTPFDHGAAGGGAGGSVLVQVDSLSGHGSARADGGSVCLQGPPLLPGADPCSSSSGGGAGGGGRVALIATAECGWAGILSAKGGVDQVAQKTDTFDDIAQSSGQDGSTYKPAPTAQCDKTPPAISIAAPADVGSYYLHQPVNAAYSCHDEAGGSGLASCAGTVADGHPIDTSTVGSHALTVSATDVAGNSISQTVHYSVTAAPTPGQLTVLLSDAEKAALDHLSPVVTGVSASIPSSFNAPVNSPGPGQVTETVTADDGGTTVVVATGQTTTNGPGKKNVKMKVTKKGRTVLKHWRKSKCVKRGKGKHHKQGGKHCRHKLKVRVGFKVRGHKTVYANKTVSVG